MIIKERSPTMRHVSRTHRVALDWLFDKINLDPKIQITYVDTKNQLADMLTKVNFTRDEWNHFLRLFNNMSFSMFSCSHISPIDNPKTMSKRQMQEGKLGQEEIVVAKSNLKVSFLVGDCQSVSNCTGFECISQPGTLKAHSSNLDRTDTGKPVARGLNENTASSSQEWHTEANTTTSTVNPMAETTKILHHNFEMYAGTVLAILRKYDRTYDKN